MVKKFTSARITVDVKGVTRIRDRLGLIRKNISKGNPEVATKLIKRARNISKEIIMSNTRGSGRLASKLAIENIPKGENRFQTRLFIPDILHSPLSGWNYGELVHEGWSRHPAPFENNPSLQEWLKRNSPGRYEFGLKHGWVMTGPYTGLKFFDIAFAEISSDSVKEFNQMINKFIKT